MAESALQLGAVVPGLGRQPERERVAKVVRPQAAELAVDTGDLQVVDAADLGDDGVGPALGSMSPAAM
jgi:hypothetical protein